jgi:threonine dehydratase
MIEKSQTIVSKVRKDVLDAEKRIRSYIRKTPLEYSPYLSHLGKCDVYLKLENIQLTGSFKIRGERERCHHCLDRKSWTGFCLDSQSIRC